MNFPKAGTAGIEPSSARAKFDALLAMDGVVLAKIVAIITMLTACGVMTGWLIGTFSGLR